MVINIQKTLRKKKYFFWFLIILMVALVITSLIILYMDTIIKPMDIVFAGAVLVLIGSIVGAIGTRKHNVSSSEKSTATLATATKTLEKTKATFETATKTLDDVSTLRKQNDSLQGKVIELTEQNANLHSKLADHATELFFSVNGKGHPVISVSKLGDIIFLEIENKNKYSIYDINISLQDPVEGTIVRIGMVGRNNGKITMQELDKLNKRIDPFTLASGEKREFYKFQYSRWTVHNIHPINIETRNGRYIGKIKIREDGDFLLIESELADLNGDVLDKTPEKKFYNKRPDQTD